METVGYIYYSDGKREEAAHMVHGESAAQSARRSVEQSTARLFAFKQRNTPSWSHSQPTRFDVQQF